MAENDLHDDLLAAARASSAGYLLKHAWLRFTALNTQALAPHGIDGRELATLMTVDLIAPVSQSGLVGHVGIDRTTMVAMIDQLEAKGLLRRKQDPEDRRRNLVELTATGRRTLRKARSANEAVERRFLSPLTDQEADRFLAALRKLSDNGEQLVDRPGPTIRR